MARWDGKERRRDSETLILPKDSNLDDVLRLLATALKSSSSNSEVLTAINNLNRKVSELMSTQEDRLKTIQGQLSGIADGINTLQQQLEDLKANNPQLDDEISAIEATVTAIRDDLNPSPPVEPPVEG